MKKTEVRSHCVAYITYNDPQKFAEDSWNDTIFFLYDTVIIF